MLFLGFVCEWMQKKNAAPEGRSTSGNVDSELTPVYPFNIWKYIKVYKVSELS